MTRRERPYERRRVAGRRGRVARETAFRTQTSGASSRDRPVVVVVSNRVRLRLLDARLESHNLALQVIDEPLVVPDVRLHGLQVLHDVRPDLLRAVGVFQSVHGVRVLIRSARHVRHHRRARVPAQRLLQQTRQLAVAERHVHVLRVFAVRVALLAERVDAIRER